MKKLSKATALLAAGTFLLSGFFMACTPHGAGGAFDTETPEPEAPEEDDGSPVDGTWDFTVSDTYSIGSSAYANLTDKELTNADAKGVTLTLSGAVKWGNGSASDASDFCLWFDKGSAYAAGKEESYSKAHFTLKTASKATLKIVATGNGSSDTDKRWVAVCDSTKKVLDSGTLTALSSGEADKTLSLSLKKGTYYIYTSGSRIRSLAITNQAFEEKTKTVTNDVDTLGLVAVNATSDDETIATAAVTDAGIVITSKKEGSTVINAAKGETEIAKIKVTVSSTGAITTNIIKYVAFTASTNNDTANDVATLGLLGTSVASSAEEYVTAEISEEKIVIKSVKAPGDSAKDITITVTDANSKTATIAVTENRDGSLTVGTITKYEVPKPVNGTDFEVSADKKLTAKKDNMEYKASSATEYTALTKDTATDELTDGNYSIRFKAVDNAYAASADTSFTVSNGGSVNCSFTLSGTAESAATEKDYDVNADEGGSGASLHFTGNAKQEANALNVQKASDISTSNFTGSKGVFTLELSGNAKVTVHYKGSGAAETARAIIIASSTDTSIKGLDNIGNDAEADIETDSALSAGTYKIYCNGIKIFKITCGE